MKGQNFCRKVNSKVNYPMDGVYLVRNAHKTQGGHGPDDITVDNGTFTKQKVPFTPRSQSES